MNRHLGWAIASVISLAGVGSASAADMAVKAPPPVIPEIFTWTGGYVGGNIGWAWGRADVRGTEIAPIPPFFLVDVLAVNAAASPRLSPSGFTGGAQAGYNWQVGAGVYGIEGDINAFDLRARTTGIFPFPSTLPGGPVGPPTSFFSPTTSVSSDWLFTGRGRIGWAHDHWLLYATGGVAVANVNLHQTIFLLPPFVWTANASSTRVGWTVGAGWEWAMNRNWSFKAEYLYVDLGNVSGTGILTPAFAGFFYNNSAHLTANIARVGFNYHFGGPVVAKY